MSAASSVAPAPAAYLVVRCFNARCGASASFDPQTLFGPRRTQWPSEAAAGRRFRCRCGAREAHASYAAHPPQGDGEGLYLFG